MSSRPVERWTIRYTSGFRTPRHVRGEPGLQVTRARYDEHGCATGHRTWPAADMTDARNIIVREITQGGGR